MQDFALLLVLLPAAANKLILVPKPSNSRPSSIVSLCSTISCLEPQTFQILKL